MVYGVAKHIQSKVPDREPITRYRSNMVSLCVDSGDGELLQGKLYHLYTKEPIPFLSLFQAVKRMNELYDALLFPETSTVFRSFSADRKNGKEGEKVKNPEKDVKEEEKLDQMLEHRGKRGTFLIRVQYRQHSSWQGEITWVEGGRKVHFRSMLEMAYLLDSALGVREKIQMVTSNKCGGGEHR